MKVPTETRERLVAAARDLFWKQGYAATGIAEILHAADAGSGSLYYFFPTKEDLLLAVLQWRVSGGKLGVPCFRGSIAGTKTLAEPQAGSDLLHLVSP